MERGGPCGDGDTFDDIGAKYGPVAEQKPCNLQRAC